jgi:hypothetical protein
VDLGKRGIGLDDRLIHADVLALEQAMLFQGAEDEQKDFVINLLTQPCAGPARVIDKVE